MVIHAMVATSRPERTVELYGAAIDFDADIWPLPNPTPAAHPKLSTIDWRVKLDDGTALTDPRHAALSYEFRTFMVGRILDCQEGEPPAPSTAGHLGQGLAVLARWMVDAGIRSMSEITSELSWDFVDYIAGRTLDEELEFDEIAPADVEDEVDLQKKTGPRFSTAIRCLNVLATIYKQRRALEKAGLALREPPFSGRTPHSVVRQELGLSRDGRLLPIPDDVAIPTLNAAIRLIGMPAQDVITLSRLHDPLRSGAIRNGDRRAAYADYRDRITTFSFSTVPGENRPWHDPIQGRDRRMLDGRKVHVKATQEVRRLVLAIVEACAVVIQGLTGIRAHELIGAKVNPTASDLPSTVSRELSRDKTTELYYFNAETFKGRRRKTRWLLGSRPIGSQYEPPTVQAFRVLEELLAPWRTLAGSDLLLITFIPAQGLPRRPQSIGKMTSGTLSVMMKEFLTERVDLSRASVNSKHEFLYSHSIRPHRWRPTFAQYLFRISPDLLPAISDHFKHMNVSITEDGYIGNDPSLIEFCDSARIRTTAEFLVHVTARHSRLAGGGARLIADWSPGLLMAIEQEDAGELIERAISLVERQDLKIYNAAYGHCLIAFQPGRSRCNQMGSGADWRRPFPNDTYRSVNTCMGCDLLVLTDKHAAFFQERAEKNEQLAASCTSDDTAGLAILAKRRAAQSRLILRKLGEEQ